jgi:hypothetical protein
VKRLVLVALLLLGCGKKETASSEPTTTAPSASALPKSEAEPKAAAAAKSVKGAYTAKQAEVRTPEDAPKFIHPESKDGIGAGELELTLPAKSGEVTGKASGALGAQVFSGFLDEGHLTGTLTPAAGATPTMWGLVDATVEGGSVKGTIRASGGDGRVVREATFEAK